MQKEIKTPKSYTLLEIMEMNLPEPKWAVPGILPEGLSILAGKPKMGKSAMALNIALAIAQRGRAFESIQVEQGSVLYLGLEDTFRRIQNRVLKADVTAKGMENMHFVFEWPKMSNGGLSILENKIKAIDNLRLVVIDTLQKIRPIRKGNHNPYGGDYDDVSNLKSIADKHEVSFLVNHHLRKGGSDDPFDTVSGTLGLTGAADGSLILERMSGNAGAALHVVGRDVDHQSYALNFDKEKINWSLIGDLADVKSTSNQQRVYNTLKEADEEMSLNEIAKYSGVKYGSVRVALNAMIKEGSIKKSGYGKYSITN